MGTVQIGVGVQDRLDGVGAAAKVPQVLDREDDRTIVEDRLLTRGKIGDITRQNRRRVHSGLTDNQPGLATVRWSQHHQQPAKEGPVWSQPCSDGDGETERGWCA
ncbi:MAG: hypothetical protein WB773_03300 [Isosphaeraceae bacterium]